MSGHRYFSVYLPYFVIYLMHRLWSPKLNAPTAKKEQKSWWLPSLVGIYFTSAWGLWSFISWVPTYFGIGRNSCTG